MRAVPRSEPALLHAQAQMGNVSVTSTLPNSERRAWNQVLLDQECVTYDTGIHM
jgi:hypothetical protein